MLAITSALVSLGLTSAAPVQRSTAQTYERATGPVKWRLPDVEDPWAKQLIWGVKLDAFTVEAVVHLTAQSVDAWKVTGEPHPDFEQRLRDRLNGSQVIRLPFRFQKRNRLVVMNSPPESRAPISRNRVQVTVRDEGSGAFSSLENDPQSKGVVQKFLSVSGNDEDRFASVPVTINLFDQSDKVDPSPGAEFEVANKRFRVVEVRPYREEDSSSLTYTIGEDSFYRTLVVLKSVGSSVLPLQASVEFERPPAEPSSRQMFVDREGNITVVGPTISSNKSQIIPFMRILPSDRISDTILLVSNLNLASLKGFRLKVQMRFEAWLDNIPLDPNPK
ncbi:MAG TPA: hypothetical protein VK171_06720 [Fimbriimonas sp.]|nr:hypothetical protein [Fimbriimonas sp.]